MSRDVAPFASHESGRLHSGAALDFALRAGQTAAGNTPAVVSEFGRIASAIGFQSMACGGWIGAGPDRVSRFYFNTWPADWLRIYEEERLLEDDPMVAEAQRSARPILWSRLRAGATAEVQTARAAMLGEAYGWREVLAVPMHGPAGYQGLLTLASQQAVALSDADILLIEIMARALHQRCRETPGFGLGTPPGARLTRRQTAVMRLVAAGKSDAAIARHLGVVEATAHFHVERAKKALGARTRAQAVALLVLAGTL